MRFTKLVNEALDDMLKSIKVTNSKTGLDFKNDYKMVESRGEKALKILDELAKEADGEKCRSR